MDAGRARHHRFVGKLLVDTEFGSFLGDTRIRLLEAIDRHGSITKAAKAVPLSYKAAWDAVEAMNNIADEPLVERSAGGRHGGGTVLTAYGQRTIAMFRAVEREYQLAFDNLAQRLGGGEAAGVRQFQNALRRMSLKTSARNQFLCVVGGMRESDAGFEVRLALGPNNEISALVTRESAENLGLRIGTEVHAFFKATSVRLIKARAAALNRLPGEVDRVRAGALTAEIGVAIGGGRTVTATIGVERLKALALAPGAACCAVIEPTGVILVSFD